MSDDLVERLRSKDLPLLQHGSFAETRKFIREAADRIEQSERDLAKAVEALKRIARQPDFRLPSHQEIARETLAELEAKE